MDWVKCKEKLEGGEDIHIKPSGNSMNPLIKSGDKLKVTPVHHLDSLETGDIVFCKVQGHFYIHKITKVDPQGRFMISNNKGHDNGWTKKVYGKVTEIEGVGI